MGHGNGIGAEGMQGPQEEWNSEAGPQLLEKGSAQAGLPCSSTETRRPVSLPVSMCIPQKP